MALAGKPVVENGPGIIGPTQNYDGFIKIRLGHGRFGSVVIPEQVIIKNAGWQYFQPFFFDPPQLIFDIEPDISAAKFSIDIGEPRERKPRRVMITIRSDGLLKSYSDGSQIYACIMEGPMRLSPYASGKCTMSNKNNFSLKLYHHTSNENYPKIKSSGKLWSSPWNLAGTRKLQNVAYSYLTSLSKILDEDDLHRIAMASVGKLPFQTTSARPIEEVMELTVYRENTTQRTARILFEVPWELISPSHLLVHRTQDGTYYEIMCPQVFRVGVIPNAKLSIEEHTLNCSSKAIKSFDYIIVGEAETPEGLRAPYDEDSISMIMHCTKFLAGQTFHNFWQQNQNSDQITGRKFEEIKFSDEDREN